MRGDAQRATRWMLAASPTGLQRGVDTATARRPYPAAWPQSRLEADPIT